VTGSNAQASREGIRHPPIDREGMIARVLSLR